jgi:hypothetical protein
VVGLHLVFGGRAGDRDRQRVAGLDATQPGIGIADFSDLLGIPGMIRRGVQNTTGE